MRQKKEEEGNNLQKRGKIETDKDWFTQYAVDTHVGQYVQLSVLIIAVDMKILNYM